MVGWHHRLNGHEFEQALGVGDGQGNLACCSPGVAKSWTLRLMTQQLSSNSNSIYINIQYTIQTRKHTPKCQFSSVFTQSCPALRNPMDCSMPGFPVHHQLPKVTQTHVHRVGDPQPSHPSTHKCGRDISSFPINLGPSLLTYRFLRVPLVQNTQRSFSLSVRPKILPPA